MAKPTSMRGPMAPRNNLPEFANHGLPLPPDPNALLGPGQLRYLNQGPVPNNPVIARSDLAGMQQVGGTVVSNPYGDWADRLQNLKGAVPTFAITPADRAPAVGRMMSPQPEAQLPVIDDQLRINQGLRPFDASAPPAKLPSPLDPTPDELARFQAPVPAQRYGTTGTPIGTPLPPQPPGGREDLMRIQTPISVNELMSPQMTVLGDPSQASLPRAGGARAGGTPTGGGKPVDTPSPARS